ncbi:MAG: hypothetical protein AAGB12_09945 [Pseudomonadota bacterium]
MARIRSFRYSPQSIESYTSDIRKDSACYIENVDTIFSNLQVSNELSIPVTINNQEYKNSYVNSPYTALIPYCKQELKKVDSQLLRLIISTLIFSFDNILKSAKINKVVQLNNWMLSTNLFPDVLNKAHILKARDLMLDSNPKHVLMFRSLNYHNHAELIEWFQACGFCMLPMRQVYLFDKDIRDFSKTHNYKMDKKLIGNTSYKLVQENDITKKDYPRIIELYNMLYINKYSQHNPKFTTQFIELIAKHPNFMLEGFRNNSGTLDAVGGRFEMDGIVTLPIVGYDTSKHKKFALYRLVMMSTLLYAETHHLVFNASSGASHFKRLRGAVPFIEYAAVHYKNLPFYRKMLWKFLNITLTRIFIPIMKKYEL